MLTPKLRCNILDDARRVTSTRVLVACGSFVVLCVCLVDFICDKNIIQDKNPHEYNTPCRTPLWEGTPFRNPQYLLQPHCDVGVTSDLLIYCYTQVLNLNRRLKLRSIFEEYYQPHRHGRVSMVFVIGTTSNRSSTRSGRMGRLLKMESRVNGDILQVNETDSYFGLAHKGLGIFSWVNKCGNPKMHLAKIDDDDDLNIHRTLLSYEMLRRRADLGSKMGCGEMFYKIKVHGEKPKITWMTSEEEYPEPYYPPYCFGAFVTIFNYNVAMRLLNSAKGLPVFHTDDVYISGLLRQRSCVDIYELPPLSELYNNIDFDSISVFQFENAIE